MPFVIGALLVLVLAYRFYYSFVAAKLATISDSKLMPSQRLYDGQNYYPMNKWVLFGHHFAAIAGAGPLVGPVLAAQFGFMPGFIWMLAGAVLAGAMHDLVILVASINHDGKSLAEIARTEISKVSGATASFAILLILIVAMAGLGLVVVNALAESSWGTFTIAMTIPIALLMGVWMFKIRKGKTVEATIAGVILLSAAVIFGNNIAHSGAASLFLFDHKSLTLLLVAYGFIASVLPVWLLLSPRDYLSSIMKLSVVGLLAIGIIIVAPTIHMPAFTPFTHGGGPIIPGKLFPYLFITIACGAISGFHALVSSGTTPKMIMSMKEVKFIAAGAMLSEGMVSILALIAATSLLPLDYFQINVPVEKFQAILPQLQAMGFTESNLNQLSAEVGEKIAGRTGGAVSLGVGMAYIFSSIPGLQHLMSYWYHFAIMFEALFILTTIDAGTRIGRFILQETLGKIYKPFGRTNWLPGNLLASGLIVLAWGYFIYTGSVSTIWPMFGTANQLLATVALAIGTSFIINRGLARYSWMTIIPMVFVGVTTLSAAYMNMTNIYLPQIHDPVSRVQGIISFTLTAIIILCVLVVFIDAIPKWIAVMRGKRAVVTVKA
ncbi:MAG TPA: carbon starvation protein A [Bacteroidales bacterium]|nr:carbon starvation protein A [Bacteroidales bacterium]HPT02699.1 carbon starvation protein A [Bacteroidales bacterium]